MKAGAREDPRPCPPGHPQAWVSPCPPGHPQAWVSAGLGEAGSARGLARGGAVSRWRSLSSRTRPERLEPELGAAPAPASLQPAPTLAHRCACGPHPRLRKA